MRILLALALILPLVAVAADKPVISTADLKPPEDLVRATDAAFTMMMTPGEADPDWQRKGVDLIERLRTTPGGVDGVIAADDTAGGRSVRYHGAAELPVPETLEAVLNIAGAPMPGDVAFQDISEVEAGVWLHSRGRLQRRGNALCGKGWESARVLVKRAAPLSEDAQIMVMVARLLMTRLREVEMCAVMVEQTDGSLLDRSYLPDGRSLPAIDGEATPMKLRPLADAAAIIQP